MNSIKPLLPPISDADRTPLVDALLELLQWQSDRIEQLEDDIHRLNKQTRKPKFKSSKMDQHTEPDDGSRNEQKKGPKRSKTQHLTIHEERIIQPANLSEDARFKGYRDIIVQDLIIRPHTIRYRLAEDETSEGYVIAQLPESVRSGHWGSNLHSFILYQYHHQHVTQPLLLEQLHDLGIDMSSGQLSQMLTKDLDVFHQEKDDLLRYGLPLSSYIHTDDTGARHQGKTGYCTHIGNELFAWFESTESKSRVNFLELLSRGGCQAYVINAGALEYMQCQKLPNRLLESLETQPIKFETTAALEQWLEKQGITNQRHQRILTEGMLIGRLLDQGIPINLGIVSDDAGQFNVFDHALCWIHAERLITRLIPVNNLQKQAVSWARDEVWSIYAGLKRYKTAPDPAHATRLKAQFHQLVSTRTDYETLNQILKRMGNNQHELFRVLERPEIPLHNNLSERDSRDYVKKRKISGSTRSEAGRQCRDTFASLKKTCRKHGISFWSYLLDRTSNAKQIPSMADILQAAACG